MNEIDRTRYVEPKIKGSIGQNRGRIVKKIIVPKTAKCTGVTVDSKQIEAYFEDGGKAPSIKEQLILKAYEITNQTQLLYECEEAVLLYSEDATGIYLSCFNKTAEELAIDIPLSIMDLKKEYTAYCVLTCEKIGILNDELDIQIPDGGVLLIKLVEAKEA